MKRVVLGTLATLVSAAMLTGCAMAVRTPVTPGLGVVYADYSAPIDTDQDGLPMGSRTGRAETESYFGIVSTGDSSISAAARNGGITNIHGADYEYYNILGVYQRYTTIVNGE